MPDLSTSPSLAKILADMERRLRNLESAPQLQRSSLTDGTITALNGASARVAEFGKLVGGGYGLAVNDASTLASLALVNDEDGWWAPIISHPWRDANASVAVTSASFVPVYRSYIYAAVARVIAVEVITVQDATTDGELRLTIEGVASTTTKVLPAGAQTNTQFIWAHGQAIGLGTFPLSMKIEARRTSGAGNINVYEPDPLAESSAYTPVAGGLAS